MKVLKKQGLTLFLIAALVVALTLGVVFAMPAKPASAAELASRASGDLQVDAPDEAAEAWYAKYQQTDYEIATPDEWNYFSVYVNSGTDSFQNKTVKLIAALDFTGKLFLPAGNLTNLFLGTFDGQGKTISGITATEKFVGLFGKVNGGAISNIVLKNSTFTVGNGSLDQFNTKETDFAGSAIAGESENTSYANLSIEDVTVNFGSFESYPQIFSGAVIGHSWTDNTIDGLKIRNTTVLNTWKAGGVVGFFGGNEFTLKNADLNGLYVRGIYCYGAVVGNAADGGRLLLENCKVNAPGEPLIGSLVGGSENIEVKGSGTDIHVGTLVGYDNGSDDTITIELSKDEESGSASQVQFEGDLPSNLTVMKEGKEIVKDGQPTDDAALKTDLENGGYVFEGEAKDIDLYTTKAPVHVGGGYNTSGGIVHAGSYGTITDALAAASEGDRIYVNVEQHAEEVTVGVDKNVTLNLLGHTLTGKITVEGTLTLENGTVTAESGDVVTVSGGTLTLAVPALDEIKELTITAKSGNAINGEYTVETNGKDVCVRKGEQEVKLAAEHEKDGNYAYTAEGAVITVHCRHDDAVLGTVTVIAPENPTFGDEEIVATADVEPEGLIKTLPEIVYKNGEGETVPSVVDGGVYTANLTLGDATASVTFTVKQKELVISNIRDEIIYQGETDYILTVTEYTLSDLEGNTVGDHSGITVTVTLQKSKYNVGKQVALITAINMESNNYTLSVTGNQAFIEVEITPATLTVGVDEHGKVVYEGFVNGDDENVLGGTVALDKIDNGDGTYTVTPSGLESENYKIVYTSSVISADMFETENGNALWIALAVAGGAIAALGAAAVVYAVRRKKN